MTKQERIRSAWGILEDVVENLVGADEDSEEDTRQAAEDVRSCGQRALDVLDGKDKKKS